MNRAITTLTTHASNIPLSTEGLSREEAEYVNRIVQLQFDCNRYIASIGLRIQNSTLTTREHLARMELITGTLVAMILQNFPYLK